jgi:outer membrane protein OmpA-like peptidoglycan-associated protein
MIIAICLFLLGASAGAYLAFCHFTKRRMPGRVAVAHGLAGASGFSVLLFFCVREPAFAPARYALGILIGAIALGCVNVVYHLRRVRHRSALIVAHALFAVGGVGTLAYGAVVHAVSTPDVRPAPPSEAAPSSPLVASAAPQAAPLSAPAVATPREGAALHHQPGLGWADNTISFSTGSAIPSQAALVDIAQIAAEINQEPGIRLIEIQGHADERGADAANVELTRARARAVVDALVARGVDRLRLKSAGFGARCPLQEACRRASAPSVCHEESSWRQDRRAAFLILESDVGRFHGQIACDSAADLIASDDDQYGVAATAQAAR